MFFCRRVRLSGDRWCCGESFRVDERISHSSRGTNDAAQGVYSMLVIHISIGRQISYLRVHGNSCGPWLRRMENPAHAQNHGSKDMGLLFISTKSIDGEIFCVGTKCLRVQALCVLSKRVRCTISSVVSITWMAVDGSVDNVCFFG